MFKENQVMIDLETWGRQPDGAIASIGAVCFNLKDGITDTFYEIVDITDAIKCGCVIHPETMKWWLKQSKSARHELVSDGIGLKAALEAFIVWYSQHRATRIWARNTVFDIALLNYAFEKTNLKLPYHRRDVRETYNFDDMDWPKHIVDKIEEIGNADVVWHNALQDATSQTEQLLVRLRHLSMVSGL